MTPNSNRRQCITPAPTVAAICTADQIKAGGRCYNCPSGYLPNDARTNCVGTSVPITCTLRQYKTGSG